MATQGYWHNTYFQQKYFEPHYWPGIFLTLGTILDPYVLSLTDCNDILSKTIEYVANGINHKSIGKSLTNIYYAIAKIGMNIREK
jgi:hypothetical protein